MINNKRYFLSLYDIFLHLLSTEKDLTNFLQLPAKNRFFHPHQCNAISIIIPDLILCYNYCSIIVSELHGKNKQPRINVFEVVYDLA